MSNRLHFVSLIFVTSIFVFVTSGIGVVNAQDASTVADSVAGKVSTTATQKAKAKAKDAASAAADTAKQEAAEAKDVASTTTDKAKMKAEDAMGAKDAQSADAMKKVTEDAAQIVEPTNRSAADFATAPEQKMAMPEDGYAAIQTETTEETTREKGPGDEFDITLRPLTLPAGTIQIDVTASANLTQGAELEPVSIAPDVFYGVTDDLTVGIVHSSRNGGFFSAPPYGYGVSDGVCVTSDSCDATWDGVGAIGLYNAYADDTKQLALRVGAFARNIDTEPLGVYGTAGVRFRYISDNYALILDPSVWIAGTDRQDPHRDMLSIPMTLQFRPGELRKVTPFVHFGIFASLDGEFNNTFTIPIALGFNISPTKNFDVGVAFAFPNSGGNETSTFSQKLLTLLLSYRL